MEELVRKNLMSFWSLWNVSQTVYRTEITYKPKNCISLGCKWLPVIHNSDTIYDSLFSFHSVSQTGTLRVLYLLLHLRVCWFKSLFSLSVYFTDESSDSFQVSWPKKMRRLGDNGIRLQTNRLSTWVILLLGLGRPLPKRRGPVKSTRYQGSEGMSVSSDTTKFFITSCSLWLLF